MFGMGLWEQVLLSRKSDGGGGGVFCFVIRGGSISNMWVFRVWF